MSELETPSAGSNQPVAPVFVRNSSGLVRALGLRDAFVLNFGYTGAAFSVSFAFMISQALWAYPNGEIGLAQVLSLILFLPGMVLVYALMSAAMPRAGGDYIYISRLISPVLGFVANFGVMMMLTFFVAWGAYWGGAQSLSTVLATLGHSLPSHGLVSASTWMTGKTGSFVVSLVIILIFGAFVMRGMRFFAKINLAFLAVGFVGMVVALVVMGVVSHATFVSNFNGFMTAFTTNHDYYHTIISRAQASGVPLSGFSFAATISLLPIIAFQFLPVYASAYVGGEVKHARRTQLISMPMALVALTILNLIVYYLLQKLVSGAFLRSVNSDYYNGQLSELPLLPFFNVFAINATGNAVLQVVIGIGYMALTVLFIPMNMVVCTRMVFAWAFDGVLPTKVADVDERTGSPIYAIALVVLLAIGFLVVLIYTTWLSTLSGIAGVLPAVILACCAAILLPLRKKSLFESSSIASYRFLGMPLVVVAGVVGAVYVTIILVAYLTNSLYLVNSTSSLEWDGGIFVVGFLIFGISWFGRRMSGVKLEQAYKEIPPA